MMTPAEVTVEARSVADPSRSCTPVSYRRDLHRGAGRDQRAAEAGAGWRSTAHCAYVFAAPRVVKLLMPFDPIDMIVGGPDFNGKSGKQDVPLGGAADLDATVQNTEDGAVRWETLGEKIGRLSESGVYFAPDNLPPPRSCRSVPSARGLIPTKTVLYSIHIPPVVVIARGQVSACALDAAIQLQARVENAENDRLKHRSVEGGDPYGSVSSTGVYHPPASIATPAVVRVRATSVADPSKSAVIQVDIPEVRLDLSPSAAEVKPGRSLR